MKKSYVGIGLLLFLFMGLTAQGDDSPSNPEKKFAEIRKFCSHGKKPKGVCACVVKNLRTKFNISQISEQQLADAVSVEQHSPPAPGGGDNRLDYMADLLTGLEYHCMETPNYSGE